MLRSVPIASAVVVLAAVCCIATDPVRVLHLSVIEQNEVERIIEIADGQVVFQVTQVALDDFNQGTRGHLFGINSMLVMERIYDVVVFGINDGGEKGRVPPAGRLAQVLEFVRQGGGVVWTHDFLDWDGDFGSPIEEAVGVGFDGLPEAEADGTTLEVRTDHPILDFPFTLGPGQLSLRSARTHTAGGQVRTATVVLDFAGEPDLPNNYYLAVSEFGKGRFVVNQIGHYLTWGLREIDEDTIRWPSEIEARIFVNSLCWAASLGSSGG